MDEETSERRPLQPAKRAHAYGSYGAYRAKRGLLFVSPEIADYVKVGGLGDVSAALPRALLDMYDVRVLIPGYRAVLDAVGDMEIVGNLAAEAEIPACQLGLTETADGLPIYVVLCPALYDREGTPYVDTAGHDWADNDIRFARLGLAAAEIAVGEADPAWSADVLHANDWQSALAPAYLKWRGAAVPSLLTIHNLAYQGLFSRESLGRIGAPDTAFQIDGLEFYDKVSFLKAGLVYSTHLTTVSGSYAREITTPESGCGLDGLLRVRAAEGRLTGILNGIDDSWDPRLDDSLAAPFAPGDWRGKRFNANAVRQSFGLAVSQGPLFSVISRLVHQKGVDLVISAADAIVAAGGQIAISGNGEKRFEAGLRDVAARHPGAVSIRPFDAQEARRLYAGSDFLLMPSRFEPCGLSQMYAQRFGSLPIAHKTGGLTDTVEDGVTGFLFNESSFSGFAGAIMRSFTAFASKRRLHGMRMNAMRKTFSWHESADAYNLLYTRAIGNRSLAA